jgi:hypothetical protein
MVYSLIDIINHLSILSQVCGKPDNMVILTREWGSQSCWADVETLAYTLGGCLFHQDFIIKHTKETEGLAGPRVLVSIHHIKQLVDYVALEEPIEFKGFRAIGYFPYEKAQLNYEACAAVPRNVFSEIETVLARTRYMDNKVVFVFEDTTCFNTDDFAIQFKDAYCKMGRLEHIMGYAARELKSL